MEEHYVYIICSEANAMPCKIGISGDVDKRLRGLQTANPLKLEVYQVYTMPNKEMAVDLEKMFHATTENRLQGEWYAMNPEEAEKYMDLNFLIRLHVSGVELEVGQKLLAAIKNPADKEGVKEAYRAFEEMDAAA